MQRRRGDQFVHHQFDHAMVEHAHQPDAFRHRDDFIGMRDGAIAAIDPHQAFIEGDVAVTCVDHRLEGERDAPVVERGHDLVAGAQAFLAQRFALRVRPIGLKGAGALFARGLQRVHGAGEHFLHIAGVARRGHPADGHRHRDRPGRRGHRLVAHAGEQPLGGHLPSRRACTGVSTTPNLLPEKRPR